MKPETRLLVQSLQACQQRVDKLVYSLGKNAEHLPATVETVAQWNEEQEESLDAFILRYSQCVTMIQEQLFKGIAYLEQEDISDKSNRDKTLLMEKLGAKATDLQNTSNASDPRPNRHHQKHCASRAG